MIRQEQRQLRKQAKVEARRLNWKQEDDMTRQERRQLRKQALVEAHRLNIRPPIEYRPVFDAQGRCLSTMYPGFDRSSHRTILANLNGEVITIKQ